MSGVTQLTASPRAPLRTRGCWELGATCSEAPRAHQFLPWPSGSHSPAHGHTDRAPSGTLSSPIRQLAQRGTSKDVGNEEQPPRATNNPTTNRQIYVRKDAECPPGMVTTATRDTRGAEGKPDKERHREVKAPVGFAWRQRAGGRAGCPGHPRKMG